MTDAPEPERAGGTLERRLGGTQPDLVMHAVEYFPDPRRWPAGSKLTQWVRPDAVLPPRSLALLAKVAGRWDHATAFGDFDARALRNDPVRSFWFLHGFYRNAMGFVGYDGRGLAASLAYVPGESGAAADLPKPGEWSKLEVPLADLGAGDAWLEGVGFLHEGGRVEWGRTSVALPNGTEAVLWGDRIGLPAEALERVKIHVEGLRKGAEVRVLFEDRKLVAEEGYFVDDFRGRDLYQRQGGSRGYGSTPVALHAYEIAP